MNIAISVVIAICLLFIIVDLIMEWYRAYKLKVLDKEEFYKVLLPTNVILVILLIYVLFYIQTEM